MPLDQEAINAQFELLAAHRRTLAHLLAQAAQFGGAVFAPPQTANGIAEARQHIRHIKTALRKNGVQVEDEPNDKTPRRRKSTQSPQPGDVMSSDAVGGDKVMGDKRTTDTSGGDYAEGNIDKRQGAFFEGSTVIGNVIGQQTNYYQPAATPLDRQQQRNRRAMLTKVKTIWIDGLLEQSLAKELRIVLDLQDRPDEVDLPLNAQVQELNHPPYQLPASIPIIEIFEKMLGTLLILGAPGAGKTTLLLELTRDLITRAEQDERHPIPVVFNLSSWSTKRRPLHEWFVEELNIKYDIPRKVAQEWLNDDNILPLLDGLDEVAANYRQACTEVINDYRHTHGFLPMAVCSRLADYDALTTKLHLHGAVVVQPLRQQQLIAYLEQAGGALAGIRMTLRDDTELWELVDNPLMLSIVTLAYKYTSPARMRATATLAERRRQLFQDYITSMFYRRQKLLGFTQQQTLTWLSWLAHEMTRQGQTVLLVERIQPEWLPARVARFQYILLDRCNSGLLCGLTFGLFAAPIFEPGSALLGGLVFGLLVMLFGGQISIAALRQRSIRQMTVDVLISVLVGLLSGAFLCALVVGLVGGIKDILVGALAGALLGGALGGLLGILTGKPSVLARHVFVIEQLSWEWGKAWRALVSGLLCGLVVGLIFGLLGEQVFGLFSGLISELGSPLVSPVLLGLVGRLVGGLVGGLGSGLIFGLLGGMLAGLGSGPLTTTIRVNEGIRRSVRSALLSGLLFGLIGGMAFGLVGGLGIGLVGALAGGIVGALGFGGYACLSHLALRLILARDGSLPLRLVPFLDFCAERIFLRKIGGGYIFIHRLLMEHFASLYTERNKPAAPPK